jgi:hypothetical protein
MTDRLASDRLTSEPIVADPEAYDSPRAELARARGLAAPYIPGGRDPDPGRARREERFYLRILIAMVVLVVFLSFALGVVETLMGS